MFTLSGYVMEISLITMPQVADRKLPEQSYDAHAKSFLLIGEGGW